jgi:hypothetical protein
LLLGHISKSFFCIFAAGELEAKDCGNHYLPEVAAKLRYFEMDWGFPIPWGHAGLLGCVKDLFRELLSKYPNEAQRKPHAISNAKRRIISPRAAHVRVPHEVGRPYKDVVHHWKSYTMEDWLHFVETYSVFVLRDILHPELAEAWEHLRAAVLHYMRLDDDTLRPEKREAARDHLRAYAVAVETYLPVYMCKFNLHLIVCHSYDQETELGSIFELLEFWIERGVGENKQAVKYRLTSAPEKVVVGHHNLSRRLFQLSLVPDLQNLPEKFFPKRGQHAKVDEAAPDESSLMGPGELVFLTGSEAASGGSDEQAVLDCLSRYSLHFPLNNVETWRFKVAWIGGELVQSKIYLRARSRVSYCVQVQWLKDTLRGLEETRFGVVQYFLKLERVVHPYDSIRLAKIDLFDSQGQERGVSIVDKEVVLEEGVFVPLDSIDTKVVFADHENGLGERTYVLPVRTMRKL